MPEYKKRKTYAGNGNKNQHEHEINTAKAFEIEHSTIERIDYDVLVKLKRGTHKTD
jgi:hypothetical protein